ncbi:MAG TPA: hypothetical protein PKK61_04410 [Defluviitaleaceae bacterium]|nr:hypothetical protein [Defluviitaleaceae bacterium]
MGTLNQNGYSVTTYLDKRNALVTVFKNAFGSNLRTDEETPQGQLIDYITTLQDNEDKIGLAIFNQLNYRQASGALLSAIAISKGQPRRSGTKAVINCNFISNNISYTIPANTLFVESTTGLKFVNQSSINIISNPQSVQLIAQANGITNIVISASLTAQSYIPALTNIAVTSIIDGKNNENDQELIERLSASDSETGRNDIDSISDSLNRLTDTTRVTVFENATSDIVSGVPPYTIEARVVGGLNQDIAKIILDFKASGTPTYGNTSVNLTDSQGFPRIINFTRPALVSMYARIRLTNREGTPIAGDIDSLKQLTMDYINSLKIGADVSRTPIFGIFGGGSFDISQISLSNDGVTWVDTNFSIGFREYAFTSNLNQITVEYV